MTQFNHWTHLGDSPVAAVISTNASGKDSLWVVYANLTDTEVSGIYTPYLAAFDSRDGHVLTSGSMPAGLPKMAPVRWDPTPVLLGQPSIAPFLPEFDSGGSAPAVTTFLARIRDQFDELPIENRPYVGKDDLGHRETLNWKMVSDPNHKPVALSIRLVNQAASFDLNPNTRILRANLAQFTRNPEGTFLVIETPSGQFWLHEMEGNTTVKVVDPQGRAAVIFFNEEAPARRGPRSLSSPR